MSGVAAACYGRGMIEKTTSDNKRKTADPPPFKPLKPKPIEVVSLDVGEEGEETADLGAEMTRNLLEDAQEERYDQEVGWYTDDEEIEDSLLARQQWGHGRPPLVEKLREHHSESPQLSAGDVDAAWDQANDAGEETVGGTAVTPDQDVVDEIGEALGITYEDDEPLQTADKIAKRDQERWELDAESAEEKEQ